METNTQMPDLRKHKQKVSRSLAEHIHFALTKQTDVLSSQLLNLTFGALSVFARCFVQATSLRADLCECVCVISCCIRSYLLSAVYFPPPFSRRA